MRPIDADEVIVKLKENATEMEADIYYGSNIGVPVDEIEDIVNECKTINQKHGHWNEIECGLLYECSQCKHLVEIPQPFCSKCGAKMDEERQGNRE